MPVTWEKRLQKIVTASLGQCCDGDKQGCRGQEVLTLPGEDTGMEELEEGGGGTQWQIGQITGS